jgi:serine/threonine protein phosphatase PrpC
MPKPPTGPSGPMPPEMMKQPAAFEAGFDQRPDERKNHDRFVVDLENLSGNVFVGIFDGTSDGKGAEAAEAAREATHDYVVDEITPVLDEEVGVKILVEALYVAHPFVEAETGTINTNDVYEEGGTTTGALALIHSVESGGRQLAWASAGDSLFYIFDRADSSLITLNAGEQGNILHNPIGGWGFGGLQGMTEGEGVDKAGSIPWLDSYVLIAGTDGLDVDHDKIISIMEAEPNAEAAAKQLVAAAAENPDNNDDITGVVVHAAQAA